MCVADLYVVQPGSDDERARYRAEREAGRARVRARYAAHLAERTGLDDVTTDLVMAVLFDHLAEDGTECLRSSHPKLPEESEYSHDVGFDCPCTWDAQRREQEQARRKKVWDEWHSRPEAEARRESAKRERDAIDAWVAAHPGVAAERTVFACPEVWEGTIDGHSFYFRERHGEWRIEIDLEPNGTFANRYACVDDNGKMLTEPVELTSGDTIAEGSEANLGAGAVEHLSFIVDTVRTHLAQATCPHPRAERYCPACGARVSRVE